MLKNSLQALTASSQTSSSFLWNLFAVGMGSILISLCAPISIKLPFTPVPIAIASHLCLLMGMLLGSKRGALAVIFYLIQGALGLPVFALGDSGIFHLLGPRGGYLFGYVAATYVSGYLLETMQEKSAYKTFLALGFGNAIIFLLGVLQLSLFIGLKSAILFGFFPFLIGDILKTLILSYGSNLKKVY